MIDQGFQSFLAGFNPQEILRNALVWIDSLGSWGAIAFILLYILATVAFLPGSLLTLGAGVVFGVFFRYGLCIYWGNPGRDRRFFGGTLFSTGLGGSKNHRKSKI